MENLIEKYNNKKAIQAFNRNETPRYILIDELSAGAGKYHTNKNGIEYAYAIATKEGICWNELSECYELRYYFKNYYSPIVLSGCISSKNTQEILDKIIPISKDEFDFAVNRDMREFKASFNGQTHMTLANCNEPYQIYDIYGFDDNLWGIDELTVYAVGINGEDKIFHFNNPEPISFISKNDFDKLQKDYKDSLETDFEKVTIRYSDNNGEICKATVVDRYRLNGNLYVEFEVRCFTTTPCPVGRNIMEFGEFLKMYNLEDYS